MFTKAYKVYGFDGHRQAVSFGKSSRWDFSEEHKTRVLTILNSDVTGTNDYTIVIITRDTEEDCDREIEGQLSDGIFENYRYGNVEAIELQDTRICDLYKVEVH